MYVLKNVDDNTFFCGGVPGHFIGWRKDKKLARRYDVNMANDGVRYWSSKGKNVKKVPVTK